LGSPSGGSARKNKFVHSKNHAMVKERVFTLQVPVKEAKMIEALLFGSVVSTPRSAHI
jgi:hypothetical protein